MAKDPAFLFYTNDFYTGTIFMSDEQVGMYVRLLCLQHQKGHLEEKHMLNICKTYDKDVFSKFIQDNEGKYFNERLEIEIDKRNKYCENRGKNSKKKKSYDDTYENHSENEDEDTSLKGVQGEEITQEKNGYITPKLFEDFWELYPKKTDKGKAKNKWEILCTKKENRPVWKEIRKALHDQIKSERWQNKQYIPMPTTWLNQSRWLDDPKEMVEIKFNETQTFKCPSNWKFGVDYEEGKQGCRNCEEYHPNIYAACKLKKQSR